MADKIHIPYWQLYTLKFIFKLTVSMALKDDGNSTRFNAHVIEGSIGGNADSPICL